MKIVEYAYQFVLMEEERLVWKQTRRGRGHSLAKGRGQKTSRSRIQKHESNISYQQGKSSRGNGYIGKKSSSRGRDFKIRCYKCNKYHHRSYDCTKNTSTIQGSAYITKDEEEIVTLYENSPEVGESLLMKRVLLKTNKEVQEPTQRKNLFRTICKPRGKCYKVVIDSESIDNLVSRSWISWI